MKKRYLLQIGAASIGAIVLSRYIPSRLEAQATSEGEYQINKTEAEWREILTPEQFDVLRKRGTEVPLSSVLDKQFAPGTYYCAGCNLPLFSSTTKFDSGTGWPSFYAAIADATRTTEDSSLFMSRTEVHCRRCGGHLGHVFDDGPLPTRKRYCMNGVSLKFVAA
jgi:peptide-methionine (R)-S-oxide reductase